MVGSGFWPGGLRNPEDAFGASAALLKGMLVTAGRRAEEGKVVQVYEDKLLAVEDPRNAVRVQILSDCTAVLGDPLLLCRDLNMSLARFPNVVQGFGRPVLESLLYFSEASSGFPPSSSFLFLQDLRAIAAGEEHSYCFYMAPRVQSPPPFLATLAWTDPPGTPAASRQLVSDLDLQVEETCGETLLGNSVLFGGKRDDLNNVERVELEDGGGRCAGPLRRLTVTVKGTLLPLGSQNYSLVVSSGFLPCSESIAVLEHIAEVLNLLRVGWAGKGRDVCGGGKGNAEGDARERVGER
eukprot:373680-Hanusia_phi.AAC.4